MHALGISVLRITTIVNESDKNEHYSVYMFAGVSSYEHLDYLMKPFAICFPKLLCSLTLSQAKVQ